MTASDPSNFYTIPPGLSFVDLLAAGVLDEYQDKIETLPTLHVLLPTRRACRALRDAFLRKTGGRPILLPRIQPLGDVEEDELSLLLSAQNRLDLPPSIAPLRRQGLLAQTLLAMPDYAKSPDQALALANELGRLMDQIHTEGLDIKNLATLAGAEFARHWQITLDFLKIIAEHWPAILAEQGAIDAADRRDRLIRALTQSWAENPPPFPILAAGSTGSIPATALLLKTIASLPQGRVVLPGLDRDLDPESWNAIDDTHPQATLKTLLETCGIARENVTLWPAAANASTAPGLPARQHLASEITRPPATSGAWQNRVIAPEDMATALSGIRRYDCDTPQDEAATIAILLRETLETPGKTAALVTPDRTLARRVAAACRRWALTLDDSGGRPLNHTPIGNFLLLTARAATDFAPVALLSALRHKTASGGMAQAQFRRLTQKLDALILRGPKPAPGLSGLRARLMNRVTEDQISENTAAELIAFLDRLQTIFDPLSHQAQAETPPPFLTLLEAHLQSCEALAATQTDPGATILWRGEDGEAAALFLAELRQAAPLMPDMVFTDYPQALETLLRPVAVRPAFGAHPRLTILGQLEARMVRADRVILGGLNEGTWPDDPGHDPWMSRPMRRTFGLPSPERTTGLSAHDFVAGFCAPEVFITRSLRADGAPTVPARWLQRLDVVLQAHGIDPAHLTHGPHPALARQLDLHQNTTRASERPAPTPPLSARPRRLSVTQIDTWLRDPYAIYARFILKLKKLDPLEKETDLADRGTILHAAFQKFVETFPGAIPDNAPLHFLEMTHAEIKRRSMDPALWQLWKPRLLRIGEAFSAQEKEWRTRARIFCSEKSGTMELSAPAGPFTLSARADRIDRLKESGFALIDYKSGGNYNTNAMQSGALPQLPLEALILENGGFENAPAGSRAVHLAYWVATGKRAAPFEVRPFEDAPDHPLSDLIEKSREGLMTLIRTFDDPTTPYYSVPRLDRAPRFNDYEHLARIKEWAALDEPDSDDTEAAA